MKQEDTKNKILEKALELFSSKGYDSVSVGEIAGAVGIKAPSLYNHFQNKRAIFDAILESASLKYERYASKIDVHIKDAKKDTNVFLGITEDLLVQKVRKIFEYSVHDKTISGFRRMLTIEQFRSPELSDLYSVRYAEGLIEYHAQIFKALIDNGELKDNDPKILAMMYAAPILILLGICDRQPNREKECVEKLDAHVRLFYRTYNVSKR